MNHELAEFAELFRAWHAKKVGHLRYVQASAKDGTRLVLGDDEEGVAMTNRDAQFFKLGLEAALVELGTLPFTVTPGVDADAVDDED